MSNTRIGVKKSNFIDSGTTTISNSATFDYVESGVNKKVSLTNLIPQFGTTGQIVSTGGASSVPVLDDQGTVKVIRSIVAGVGAGVNLLGNGDIEIATDYSFDTSGVTVVDDVSAPNPNFRSFIGGDGINVSGSAGEVQIALSDTPVTTKTVLIGQLSDLPEPVVGVITLVSNTEYFFTNDVDIGLNTIFFSNDVVISSSSPNLITITYTGTGALLEVGGGRHTLSNVEISTPNGAALNVAPFSRLFCDAVRFVGDSVGVIDSCIICVFDYCEMIGETGMTFTGANGVFGFDSFVTMINSGVVVDLTDATFLTILISRGRETSPAPVSFLSGLPGSANIDPIGSGLIEQVSFLGDSTPLTGVGEDDSLWAYRANNKIKDTSRRAMMSFQNGTDITPITAINTYVKVVAAWSEQLTNGFTTDPTGTIMQDLVKNETFNIDASLAATKDGGGGDIVASFAIAKGFPPLTVVDVVEESSIPVTLDNDDDSPTPLTWGTTIQPGEVIEVWCSNTVDTDDIVVSAATIRIS